MIRALRLARKFQCSCARLPACSRTEVCKAAQRGWSSGRDLLQQFSIFRVPLVRSGQLNLSAAPKNLADTQPQQGKYEILIVTHWQLQIMTGSELIERT